MFLFRHRRRRRLAARPFPQSWIDIVQRNVAYYRCLLAAEREELHGHINIFLAEKRFEGCAGLVITDEIRVTIAAQACILLLGRETDYYPSLHSILVYPHGYIANTKRQLPGGVIVEGPDPRLGESWHRGSVVLSWSDARAGGADPRDGQNVVYHEFAHQLDSESGAVEGAPGLKSRESYRRWSETFQREYDAHLADTRAHRPTLFGAYAATSPPEFFAVATEVFFERPRELQARHPELYQRLSEYFRQDPAPRLA
jgi:hypothetical protein